MFVALLLSGAMLAEAAPAAGAAPSAKPTPAASAPKPAEKPKKAKVVCHSESTIGSLFPTKICTTVEQDKDRQMQDREALERMQQTTVITPH